jgi:hypothetical protein
MRRDRAIASEWNGQGIENGEPRPEGGLEDPDALGWPDEVHAIEDVEQDEPVDDPTDARDVEAALRAEIHLDDRRQLL